MLPSGGSSCSPSCCGEKEAGDCSRFLFSDSQGMINKKNQGKGGNLMSLSTKRAMAEAFKKLLSQRGMDKITVKDIVEECANFLFYIAVHGSVCFVLKNLAEGEE